MDLTKEEEIFFYFSRSACIVPYSSIPCIPSLNHKLCVCTCVHFVCRKFDRLLITERDGHEIASRSFLLDLFFLLSDRGRHSGQLQRGRSLLQRSRRQLRRPKDAHQRHHRGLEGPAVLLRSRLSQAQRLLPGLSTDVRRYVHSYVQQYNTITSNPLERDRHGVHPRGDG